MLGRACSMWDGASMMVDFYTARRFSGRYWVLCWPAATCRSQFRQGDLTVTAHGCGLLVHSTCRTVGDCSIDQWL